MALPITASPSASVGDRGFGSAPASMGSQTRKIDLFVPECQREIDTLLLQPDGKPPRTFQCPDCDRPDPLKADPLGWLTSGLSQKE